VDGRAFLGPARLLLSSPDEANWRSAVGPLYLSVLHEGRAALERWGFPLPPGADLHAFVDSRFGCAPHLDLLRVQDALDRGKSLREEAEQALASPGRFATDGPVSSFFSLAEQTVLLLDAIEGDPARRAAAIAAIRAAYP
jgi:hypothetical protein